MASLPDPSPFHAAFRLLTLQRISLWRLPGEPRAVGLLWIGAYLALKVASPDRAYWYYNLDGPLAQLGLAVIAGLFAAALLRKSGDALRFVFAFLLIATAALLLQTALYGLAPEDAFEDGFSRAIIPAAGVIAALRFIWTATCWNLHADRVRASVAAGLVLASALAWNDGVRMLYRFAAEREDRPELAEIDPEQLWTAQSARLAAELAKLPPGHAAAPRTFVVGVAAGGTQRIFGREVAQAGSALVTRFGAGAGAAILSNSAYDIMHRPMANRSNLAALLDTIGRRADPQRDLVIVYLASHGSRDAVLSTGLPDYTRLQPISADHLAGALRHAGIGRRIVVVSACYSGSWIKPLAAPDAIVLTASAADRTSFGCDDKRDTTVFGETFIRRIGTPGTSLKDMFDGLQRDIARDETADGRTPSQPQREVGAGMQSLWTARD